MTTRWARFARGWLAALVSTFIAVCSHTIAGGSLPSAVAIALSLAFSGMVSVALAGKTLSLLRLALAVAVSQFAFHGAFSLLGESTTMPRAADGAGMQHSVAHLASEVASFAVHSPVVMGTDATMWVGHAVAAAVTIVALRRGERAFWGLFELALVGTGSLWRLLARSLPAPRWLRPRASSVAVQRALVPRPVSLVFAFLSHRGPPAFAAI
jgi:hypothetical protein